MAVTKSTTFSETYDTPSNTSSLTFNIYFSPNNNDTFFLIPKTIYCTCQAYSLEGALIYDITQDKSITLEKGSGVSVSFTFSSIPHLANGAQTAYWSWSCATQTQVLGTITDSGSKELVTIPRYANFTEHYVSARSSHSISVHWNADAGCDAVQYSLNNGAWTGTSGLDYTIDGLSPDTSYNIRTRIKRTDSQLWTISSTLTQSTFKQTIPTIALSSKTINSITVTSDCNVTVSSTHYRIKRGSGNYGDYQTSATFNDLSPNASYTIEVKKVGTDSGEAGTATISVTTYDYAKISSYPNFNLGDSETITYSNPSDSSIQMSIYDTGGNIIYVEPRTVSGTSYTFNFTDTELDKLYKAIGTNNSLQVRVYLRTACNGTVYSNYKTVTINLTGNQKTTHVKVSNSWKRAKHWVNVNGTWKRAVRWINVNGTWKRCI